MIAMFLVWQLFGPNKVLTIVEERFIQFAIFMQICFKYAIIQHVDA